LAGFRRSWPEILAVGSGLFSGCDVLFLFRDRHPAREKDLFDKKRCNSSREFFLVDMKNKRESAILTGVRGECPRAIVCP